jgi:RNA polymerase sigma-70 factor (ECF subfamily)
MDESTRAPAPPLPLPLQPASSSAAVATPGEPCTDEEFEQLLTSFVDPAYRLAFRLTSNRQDAEDLVQEAALRAYRARASFACGSSFRAWFYRILLNTLYTKARRRRPESSMDELEDAHDLYLYSRSAEAGVLGADADPLAGTLTRMTADQVTAALASLPDEFRTVATLYFMDDLSYQEIAESLGVPVGTVRSRLHRGRRMLQKRLWILARELGIVTATPASGPAIQSREVSE